MIIWDTFEPIDMVNIDTLPDDEDVNPWEDYEYDCA